MYAVEKFAHPIQADARIVISRSEIEGTRLTERIDFAYSNDVLEHVSDVLATMQAVFALLRPGGRFVSSIDLRGHNAFNNPARPLDFLTCPDWLWRLMFSHMVTTNRFRAHAFMEAASSAGFRLVSTKALALATPDYLESIRPHMLPRFRGLPDSDLAILQLLLVLERS